MSLANSKKMCTTYARMLPKRYEDYDITELANGYCDASDSENEINRDIYFSALVLRYWYTIEKMYQKCYTAGVEREEMFNLLCDCILAACKYRAWRDPSKKTNADACIKQVIGTRGAPSVMYESNLKKTIKYAASLDSKIDSAKSDDTYLDQIVDTGSTADNAVYDTVQSLIDNNDPVAAIVADVIAYNDVSKHTKYTVEEEDSDGNMQKYTRYSSERWDHKIADLLKSLDDNYKRSFHNKYSIDSAKLDAAVSSLVKTMNGQKKYTELENDIDRIKRMVA